MMKRNSTRYLGAGHLLLLLAIAAFQFACAEEVAGPTNEDSLSYAKQGKSASSLTVLTRNVYVGTDVDAILAGGSMEDALQTLIATNFPERAQALAEEIAAAQPHIIGLQEISELSVEIPAAGFQFEMDYLDILLATLSSKGLDYYVVGEIMDTHALVADSGIEAELRDYDVLLARGDVETSDVLAANYTDFVSFGPLEIRRGYVAANATADGRTYRVVTTHLEPFISGLPPANQFQVLQANELLTILSEETMPVIVMGDLNTGDISGAPGDAYRVIAENFTDVWTVRTGRQTAPGYTCCQEVDLKNESSNLDRRFDLIFYRSNGPQLGNNGLAAVFFDVLGDEPADKTQPAGLWPSDHAGVVATLQVPAIVFKN
jgi:endonuclease/exonuclease/phosphatase family metal-dependent hydrolase